MLMTFHEVHGETGRCFYDDARDMRRPEMPRKQERTILGALLQQAHPRCSRHFRQFAEFGIPVRGINLQRVMDRVAGEHRPAGGIGQPHRHMAVSMSRRRFDRHRVIDCMIAIDQHHLPRLDDRQNAVAIGAATLQIGLSRGIASGVADLVLDAREQIACVRKCGHPAPVNEFRIPADVIGMKVRAQHDVDLFRRDTGQTKAIEIGCV